MLARRAGGDPPDPGRQQAQRALGSGERPPDRLWGKNAAETNIHQSVFVDRALEAGGRLVVIDPRRTQTAEGAELLIQPRPGTDGALALAVAHLLVEGRTRGSIAFVGDHVLGFDELTPTG